MTDETHVGSFFPSVNHDEVSYLMNTDHVILPISHVPVVKLVNSPLPLFMVNQLLIYYLKL